MIEGYSPWSELDENRRYCLIDTTDIVEVYRSMPDVLDGVRDVIGDRTLLVVPNVVAESAGVCKELSGKDWDDLKTLESDIMSSLKALGVPVEFAHLPEYVLESAEAKHAKAEYANSDGTKLSLIDCMLLCVAAGATNIDVMTEDQTLKNAIGAECGTDRTCTAGKKYQDRNARTAWFIEVVTGDDSIKWRTTDGMAVYYSGGVRAVVIDGTGDHWGTVLECSINKPGIIAATETFYKTAILNDYCKCSLEGIKALECTCIYGDELDGGLDKEGAWKFLGAMPQNERNRLWALVKSFGNDAQRPHGRIGRNA